MVAEGYKNTEIGVIPEEWEVKTIGDIGDVKMCKRIFQNQTQSVGDIPFYKIGTFAKEADAFISKELFLSYKQQYSYPQKGDILISAAGTIGRTLIFDGKPSYFQDSNIVWIDNDEKIVSNKLLYYIFQIVKYKTEGGTIQRLYNTILRNAVFPLPPLSEQTAIATALSDADSLITATEKLIAKKKAIKQGAMQELLKPKKGWEEKKIGEDFDILKGHGLSKSQLDDNGIYKCILYGELYTTYKEVINFVKSKTNNKDGVISQFGDILFPGSTTTIGIDLAKCSTLLVDNVKLGGDIIVLRKRNEEINTEFIAYYLNIKCKYAIAEKAKGVTIYHLHGKDLIDIQIFYPDFKEQTRIATILSDMDAEISLLEQKLEKQKQIKKGMMQNLLTGKIRLLGDIEAQKLLTNKTIKENTKYKDAVLITAVVNTFYSEKYPLGRKKVQKLLYLVLRKQETSVLTFKRKAAGPYAHTVRYNGGETIAISKHYINAKSNKQGTIFSKGDNREEALAYIDKWGLQSFIDWLDLEFKYKNANQLEVLTTIDMAICDLKKENKSVSLQTIKELIKADKVWKKKLEKPYFSDIEIQKAIDESNRLFGNG